jgi:hypothetical protein
VLQTEDLFLGAFGLTRGGELAGIEVRGVNGRRMAVFHIEGEGMAELEREYHRGPSLVDLRLLKSEVARLKNLAFGAIREIERVQREQARRGRSQEPRSLDGRQEGNQESEAHRQSHLRGGERVTGPQRE